MSNRTYHRLHPKTQTWSLIEKCVRMEKLRCRNYKSVNLSEINETLFFQGIMQIMVEVIKEHTKLRKF